MKNSIQTTVLTLVKNFNEDHDLLSKEHDLNQLISDLQSQMAYTENLTGRQQILNQINSLSRIATLLRNFTIAIA